MHCTLLNDSTNLFWRRYLFIMPTRSKMRSENIIYVHSIAFAFHKKGIASPWSAPAYPLSPIMKIAPTLITKSSTTLAKTTNVYLSGFALLWTKSTVWWIGASFSEKFILLCDQDEQPGPCRCNRFRKNKDRQTIFHVFHTNSSDVLILIKIKIRKKLSAHSILPCFRTSYKLFIFMCNKRNKGLVIK